MGVQGLGLRGLGFRVFLGPAFGGGSKCTCFVKGQSVRHD